MGILGRINRVIKSNVNELVESMSDPAKEIDLLIIEMEGGLKKARDEIVSATAHAKRAEQHLRRLQEDSERWQRRAEQAVRAGEDGLAREALQQRATVESDLQATRNNHDQQLAYVGQLKDSLQALESRLRDVKARKETLKQRARAAKKGEHRISGGKAFSEFDRLESRIEAMEEASELTTSAASRDAATEAKFRRLERESGRLHSDEVEDELAALKKRLEQGES